MTALRAAGGIAVVGETSRPADVPNTRKTLRRPTINSTNTVQHSIPTPF